jgi:hypothetical protein
VQSFFSSRPPTRRFYPGSLAAESVVGTSMVETMERFVSELSEAVDRLGSIAKTALKENGEMMVFLAEFAVKLCKSREETLVLRTTINALELTEDEGMRLYLRIAQDLGRLYGEAMLAGDLQREVSENAMRGHLGAVVGRFVREEAENATESAEGILRKLKSLVGYEAEIEAALEMMQRRISSK